MIVLTEEQTAALVDDALALGAARVAFRAMADGSGVFPSVVAHGTDPGNRFTVKPGATTTAAGVKIGSFWPGNPALGLPRHSSTVVLLDQRTGRVGAVVEAGAVNGYRTAAADALAVDALARRDARVLAVFGAGHQAYRDAVAIRGVRDIVEVLVVARDPDAGRAFAARLAAAGLVSRVADAAEACERADVLVTATSAREPLFDARDVRPGTHVSAMGADDRGKQELPPELLTRATLFCDVVAQSRVLGEFQHAPADAELTPLGVVLDGRHPGRVRDDEITVFDSSGTGIQDVAIAEALLARSGAR
jgi:ornithine cyclodeaminase